MDMKVIGQGGQASLNTVKDVQKNETINKDVESKKANNKIQNDKLQSDKKNKELNEAVKKLNAFLEDEDTHAEISMHERLKTIMIKIVDSNNDVIMEVPPEKILDMVAKMCELAGVLVDKKA